MTERVDPIQLYRQLNPVSTERLKELAEGPEREATWARIIAHREVTRHRIRLPRGRLVAAVAVAVALALPALAFSGVLGSLFGFSNQGTPVSQDNLSRATAVLNLTGANPDRLVQLAARHGWAVYADRTTSSSLCFYDGPAGNSNLNEIGGGCMNAAASASFPSPSRPVWDMSVFELGPPQPGATVAGPSIARLTGVAADGVTSVQVLALADCHVVATAPVTDNVYIATSLPNIPEALIVARDATGNAVWHESVAPASNPNATSCGLG